MFDLNTVEGSQISIEKVTSKIFKYTEHKQF